MDNSNYNTSDDLKKSPLGRPTSYPTHYDPNLLVPIPRSIKREELGISSDVQSALPFSGFDEWTGYELSWLNNKGKPEVALLICEIPCESSNIIESKSFKLYLNSFNQTQFQNKSDVEKIIQKDLSEKSNSNVNVAIQQLSFQNNSSHNQNNKNKNNNTNIIDKNSLIELKVTEFSNLPGLNIDHLDINIEEYNYNPKLLQLEKSKESNVTSEILNSHLLKSNCLVTGQPDWGSIVIDYTGPKINHESLLKYIISFRLHEEFHEQCVERIFMDLTNYCNCSSLTVYARYVRRGGLDINPLRTTDKNLHYSKFKNLRTIRQ